MSNEPENVSPKETKEFPKADWVLFSSSKAIISFEIKIISTYRKIWSTPGLSFGFVWEVDKCLLLPIQHKPPAWPSVKSGAQFVQIAPTTTRIYDNVRTEIYLMASRLDVLPQVQVLRHNRQVSVKEIHKSDQLRQSLSWNRRQRWFLTSSAVSDALADSDDFRPPDAHCWSLRHHWWHSGTPHYSSDCPQSPPPTSPPADWELCICHSWICTLWWVSHRSSCPHSPHSGVEFVAPAVAAHRIRDLSVAAAADMEKLPGKSQIQSITLLPTSQSLPIFSDEKLLLSLPKDWEAHKLPRKSFFVFYP